MALHRIFLDRLLAMASMRFNEKRLQEVTIQSADGTPLYGCLKKPSGDGPFPSVIFIHGGFGNNREFTQSLLNWSIAELLLQEGFLLLSTDYRVDYEGRDVDDIIAAFKYTVQLPSVDRSRIAYFGDSHGSYLALMASLRTNPFAIVHGWGVANLAKWYDYIKNIPAPFFQQVAKSFEEVFGGPPKEVPEAYWQASVLAHVQSIKCPVLILHGDRDEEVPVAQAYELADALKRADRVFELKIFRGAGHGLRTPEVRQEMDKTILEFFKRHLGRKG